MNYLEWNDLIARHFFNEEKAGREVLLYVNDHFLEMLGSELKTIKDDFISALRIGPPWITRQNQGFCIRAYQTFENWRCRNLEFPPYLAYLAFFVLAAGSEGEFAVHAYYPRFWTLLSEPEETRMPPSFEKMIDLWDDLEKWSCEDKQETWGRFTAIIRGNWVNVGLPLSQTLLSEEERRRLPEIFEEAGLDPTTLPTPDVMCRILLKRGDNILENRTSRLLKSNKENEEPLRDALISLTLAELEDWDGIVWIKVSEEESTEDYRRMQSSLRICLVLDEVAKTVKGRVRFKANRAFPEEGLDFCRNNETRMWSCREIHQGWSTSLKDNNTAIPVELDVLTLDWLNGEQFYDNENKWRVRLKGNDARVFLPGDEDYFSEWIEHQRLERGTEFLFAYAGNNSESVKQWGATSCESFKELPVTGLPVGWKLFRGKSATVSCPGVDILSVSSSVRALVRGGLKIKGNSFLKFAPPHIVLENSTGNEKVMLNGAELVRPNAKVPIWILPKNAPVGQALRIEVKVNDSDIRRKVIKNIVLWLEEPELAQTFDSVPRRNSLGEISACGESGHFVCGTDVQWDGAESPPPYSVQPPIHLSNRIVFIGHRPGQIVDWPREQLPASWMPIWALVKSGRKEWEAVFCGSPECTRENHQPGDPLTDKPSIRQWKDFLWYQRKKIQEPMLRRLNRIWKKYVMAAKNV